MPARASLWEPGLPAMNDDTAHLMKTNMPDTEHLLEKEAYDTWLRAQVQASIDDSRPSIPDEEARRIFAIKRENIQQEKKAVGNALSTLRPVPTNRDSLSPIAAPGSNL